MLKAVATELRGFVRSYDLACRVGGEELALLLPRARPAETLARLDRLRDRIGALRLLHDGVELPTITVSIGVADIEHGAPSDLLRRADIALYAAKRAGRNRVTSWAEELDATGELPPRLETVDALPPRRRDEEP